MAYNPSPPVPDDNPFSGLGLSQQQFEQHEVDSSSNSYVNRYLEKEKRNNRASNTVELLSKLEANREAHAMGERLLNENVKTLELYLSEPFFKTFSVNVNVKSPVSLLLEQVQNHINTMGEFDKYTLEGFELRYGGLPLNLEERLSTVLTIPGFYRIDVIFSYSVCEPVESLKRVEQLCADLELLPYSASRALEIAFPSKVELARM